MFTFKTQFSDENTAGVHEKRDKKIDKINCIGIHYIEVINTQYDLFAYTKQLSNYCLLKTGISWTADSQF